MKFQVSPLGLGFMRFAIQIESSEMEWKPTRFTVSRDKMDDLGDLAHICARFEIDGGRGLERKQSERGKGGGGSRGRMVMVSGVWLV